MSPALHSSICTLRRWSRWSPQRSEWITTSFRYAVAYDWWGCSKIQRMFHHALEHGRSPVQSEGKGSVLPVSTEGTEGRFGFGSFGEGQLPVPFREVKCGDVPGDPGAHPPRALGSCQTQRLCLGGGSCCKLGLLSRRQLWVDVHDHHLHCSEGGVLVPCPHPFLQQMM